MVMANVSLRADAEERIEEGRAAIPQRPRHPVRIERLETLNDREHWQMPVRKPPRRITTERLKRLEMAFQAGKQKRLASLAERLHSAGDRIRLAGEGIRRAQERSESLERQRLERELTLLGKLANHLDAIGYTPSWKRAASGG
jgi:hypothetical protein